MMIGYRILFKGRPIDAECILVNSAWHFKGDVFEGNHPIDLRFAVLLMLAEHCRSHGHHEWGLAALNQMKHMLAEHPRFEGAFKRWVLALLQGGEYMADAPATLVPLGEEDG